MKTIRIRLLKEPNADPAEHEARAGTTVEELLGEHRSHLPYRVITARVDGDDVPLTSKLRKDCELVFCDIRDNTANRSFQRGLTLLYLKAVHDLYGDGARVLIRNSVNRGIFSTLELPGGCAEGEAPTEGDLRKIEKRMWQLVDANIPIRVSRGVSSLEGFKASFYGIMPPSTGYVYSFALEAMRGGVLLRFPHPSDPGKLAVYRRDARIFDAYDEEQRYLDGLRLAQIKDLNRQIGKGAAEDIIIAAELRQAERIRELAQMIVDSGKRVVLIAGPSSSGKTTFSKRLIEALAEHGGPEALYLGTDDYFVDRILAPRDKKGDFNYEGLDAMDIGLFVRNIEELLSGKTSDLPRYDFITGEKTFGSRKTKIKKGQAIVVEGIHALNKKMSVGIGEDVKFRIYISPLTQLNIDAHNRVPSTDVRLIRRMVRDNRTRGSSVAATIKQWPKVRAGESVNIFPYNNEADEVFNSTLIYELPVLKKYAAPLLGEVPPGDASFGHAKWLLYFLSLFAPIEDEGPIPPESLLREFIGGGRF